jgi:hypothetical protein
MNATSAIAKYKTTVLFHSADWDGLFCREIARKFLPDAELIGWDFSDEPIGIPSGQIYVLDLPCDRPFGFTFPPGKAPEKAEGFGNLIWIDHHKSSIESHPKDIPGYRIDGVAACRLAWQWFQTLNHLKDSGYHNPNEAMKTDDVGLPSKQDFIERKVEEPLAVRLAGEYDIWDKRDPNAELFQHGLRSRELGPDTWDILLSGPTQPEGDKQGLAELYVETLLEAGEALQYARTKENESIIKHNGFTMHWEGLCFLACNAARYNSLLFTAGLKPEHDACLGFNWNGKAWTVSFYHAPGKEHIDLSVLAVKYGGGGHRGAAGYTSATWPFDLPTIPK